MTIAIAIAALSLVLCVIFFIYLRWYINRKTSADMFLADYRTEVGKLVAEIDTAADRDSLLVEERMKALRKLLEDADRRIAVYVREMERRQPSIVTQPPAPVETPAATPTIPLYTSLGRSVGGLRIVNVSEPETTMATANVSDNAADSANNVGGGEKKELRVQITELAAQGLSPAEIASRLKASRSEVDLALSMAELKRGAG